MGTNNRTKPAAPDSAARVHADNAGAGRGTGPEITRQALTRYLDDTLEASRFSDYCPNGLQVEGSPSVRRIASAVTASLAVLEAAACAGVQALLVHHGWFWRGDDPRIVGTQRARIALALRADINLYAYHLPLDAHPELGNNARLAARMGWSRREQVGEYGLVWIGEPPRPTTVAGLAAALRRRLARAPQVVGPRDRSIRRIGWCTGAAQDSLRDAISAGCDAFVSGEISERTTHLAREAGIAYFAAGHHATERDGVQALGERVAGHFGLSHRFIDDDNPV